jgi:glutamate/tyrosine decarboxylase-like PLP-dependent enzyme
MSDLESLRRTIDGPLRHPDVQSLRDMSARVLAWLLDDFAGLPARPVGVTRTRAEMERLLREPPPERGREFADVFAEFQEKVAPFTFRPNHPRFFAFIPGVPTPIATLGDWLCDGLNFFAGVWLEAAGPAQVELLVLDWFKEFLGYPDAARGIITTGGSEANLTALVVAREKLAFSERSCAVLYLAEHRHWSVDRAAKVIGLGRDHVRPLPADGQYCMHPETLRRAVAEDRNAGRLPWLVVANAGATNTGTVDPLADLADVCRDGQLWFHVDAAYGWPAVLTPEGKALLSGIERADSITLDPHKWFGQTFEAGCVLVRDGRKLHDTFALRPDYLQDVAPAEDEVNFADEGLALTRRFRALKIWLSVKVLGVGWFRDLVRHGCNLAEYAQQLLTRSGRIEILSPRQLSIVCFRYMPAKARDEPGLERLNLAIAEDLRAGGRAFLSTTRLRGRVALRLCCINWRTSAPDIEETIRLLLESGERIERSGT